MIERLTYKHRTARGFGGVEIEIWKKDGKLYYNKNNFALSANLDNSAENVESSVSIEEFEKKLAALKIEEWEEMSVPQDVMVLDGSDWTVKVKYRGKKVVKREGENAYPANWNKFIKLLQLTVGKFDKITF